MVRGKPHSAQTPALPPLTRVRRQISVIGSEPWPRRPRRQARRMARRMASMQPRRLDTSSTLLPLTTSSPNVKDPRRLDAWILDASTPS